MGVIHNFLDWPQHDSMKIRITILCLVEAN